MLVKACILIWEIRYWIILSKFKKKKWIHRSVFKYFAENYFSFEGLCDDKFKLINFHNDLLWKGSQLEFEREKIVVIIYFNI